MKANNKPTPLLDLVVHSLPCAVAVLGAKGKLRQASEAWLSVFSSSLPCRDCVARGPARASCLDCLLDLVAVERRQEEQARLERFLRHNDPLFAMPLHLGHEAVVELQLRRLALPGVQLLLAVLSEAECNALLIERAERLRVLIDVMPDFLCFKDGEGRWLEANAAGLRLFQLEGVEYRGKTDKELAELSPRFRAAFLACQESDERAWSAAQEVRGEEIVAPPDGEPRVFDVYKLPLFEPDGRRKGLMVLGRDITSLKQAQERLERLTRQQQVIQSLLFLGFRRGSLAEILDKALARIVEIPWLPLLAKGTIFLVSDEEKDALRLVAERGGDEASRQHCRQLGFDHCFCASAAKERKVLFTPDLAASGLCPVKRKDKLGHYAIPIQLDDEFLGVLSLHVRPGHQPGKEEETFLTAVAHTLAILIDRCRAQERLIRSEANLAKAQRIAQLGYWEWVPGKDVFRASAELFRILDLPAQPSLSIRRLRRFVHPADRRRRFQAFKAALKAGRSYAVTYRIVRASGTVRVVHEEGEMVTGPEGELLRVFGTLQDVTELKRSEFQLELAAKVFEAAVEGITVTDAKARILMVNPAFTRITGYAAEEVIGKRPNILKSDRHDRAFYKAMWSQLLSEGAWQGEIWNRRKNGEIYPEWLSITAIKDGEGKTTHYVGVFYDMSQLRSYEEQLRFHAHHDALTGLPNRSLFLDRLRVAIAHAGRGQQRLAVLLVDLDNFKNVNDSLGHTAGDLLLQLAAKRITAQVTEDHTVARLSSDDFVVLLDQVADGRQAVQVAERIIEAMAEPFNLRVCEVTTTVSVGIALYPEDGRKADALLKNAELAMYQAKDKGKNTYQLFTKELDAQVTQRLFIEHSLRRAIERRDLVVHYQPKVSLTDGRICGAEALVRWQRADGNFVSPLEFIPIAEETGLVVQLGEQVLRRACEQAKAWLDAGHKDFVIAVNVSFRQFQQPDFPERVAAVLAATGLPAAHLELEITESVVMANEAETFALLDRLKALGVRLALDDFGTGYSSLSYLRRLPLHTLKIDRSFVRDIPEDKTCLAVAASIVELAHRLGLAVVVEGVENEVQLGFFWRQGAAKMQGFLFSPPVKAEVLQQMLAEDRRLPLPKG